MQFQLKRSPLLGWMDGNRPQEIDRQLLPYIHDNPPYRLGMFDPLKVSESPGYFPTDGLAYATMANLLATLGVHARKMVIDPFYRFKHLRSPGEARPNGLFNNEIELLNKLGDEVLDCIHGQYMHNGDPNKPETWKGKPTGHHDQIVTEVAFRNRANSLLHKTIAHAPSGTYTLDKILAIIQKPFAHGNYGRFETPTSDYAQLVEYLCGRTSGYGPARPYLLNSIRFLHEHKGVIEQLYAAAVPGSGSRYVFEPVPYSQPTSTLDKRRCIEELSRTRIKTLLERQNLGAQNLANSLSDMNLYEFTSLIEKSDSPIERFELAIWAELFRDPGFPVISNISAQGLVSHASSRANEAKRYYKTSRPTIDGLYSAMTIFFPAAPHGFVRATPLTVRSFDFNDPTKGNISAHRGPIQAVEDMMWPVRSDGSYYAKGIGRVATKSADGTAKVAPPDAVREGLSVTNEVLYSLAMAGGSDYPKQLFELVDDTLKYIARVAEPTSPRQIDDFEEAASKREHVSDHMLAFTLPLLASILSYDDIGRSIVSQVSNNPEMTSMLTRATLNYRLLAKQIITRLFHEFIGTGYKDFATLGSGRTTENSYHPLAILIETIGKHDPTLIDEASRNIGDRLIANSGLGGCRVPFPHDLITLYDQLDTAVGDQPLLRTNFSLDGKVLGEISTFTQGALGIYRDVVENTLNPVVTHTQRSGDFMDVVSHSQTVALYAWECFRSQPIARREMTAIMQVTLNRIHSTLQQEIIKMKQSQGVATRQPVVVQTEQFLSLSSLAQNMVQWNRANRIDRSTSTQDEDLRQEIDRHTNDIDNLLGYIESEISTLRQQVEDGPGRTYRVSGK